MSGIVPGPDPSMEEILASIRRILDSDPAEAVEPKPAAVAPPPLPAEDEDEDELLLDESMLVAPPPMVEPPAPAVPSPVLSPAPLPPVPAAPAPQIMTPPPVVEETPMPADPPPAEPATTLLGPAAADVTVSSMMSLVRAVASERGAAVYRGGPTIEELVREEIRPLLKEWLDSYLPPLVERLVRIEIERVVGRVAP